jgi:site-specific recombinase XerD
METKELIEKYEKNLKRKKANDKTIRNYIYDLQAFNSYMNKNLEEITEEDINNFIQEKRIEE